MDRKKDQLPQTISIWLGENAGPVPTAVKWSGARLKVIFPEVSLPHTSTMCFSLAQAGSADLPELWRLHPQPQFTSIFLCQGEGGKNHTCFSFSLFSAELISSGWTIFHISERRYFTWHNGPADMAHGGNTQWKTSLHGNASWNSQTAVPSVFVVQAASWGTGILSERMLGKAKSKCKGGWAGSWRTRRALALARVRRKEKSEIGGSLQSQRQDMGF